MSNKLPITIELKHPFEFNGETIDKIVLKKLNAWTCRFLRIGEDLTEDDTVKTLSQMSGVDMGAIDEMDPGDFRKVKSEMVKLLIAGNIHGVDPMDSEVTLPHVVKLSESYDFGGAQIKELVFKRRLKVKHVRRIRPELYFEDFFGPIASMVDMTIPEIDGMGVADFVKCVGVLFPFWLGGKDAKPSTHAGE